PHRPSKPRVSPLRTWLPVRAAELVPPQDTQGAKGVPAAGLAFAVVEGEVAAAGVLVLGEPAAGGVALGGDEGYGVGHALLGAGGGGPEVVEGAQDVVVPEGGEGELGPGRARFGLAVVLDRLAGGQAAHQLPLEQVLLALQPGRRYAL